MKKFTVYSLQFTVILILYTLYFILYTPVLAGHEIGTEGKYCDGSEIWLDLADGSHEYSETDCALSGQVCNTDAICEDPPPPPPASPDPSLDGPTPTPKSPTPDEVAVENLNQGTLPSEIIQEIKPQEENIFQKLANFFLTVLGFKPTFPEIFHPRSDTAQDAQIPSEVKPTSQDENKLLPEFLGSDTGIYSISVPKEINQDSKDTRGFENTYEKAHFPEGITPITGN